MALVLYRKYRPKTFEEVVGQEHIMTTLQNALRLDRVGHAYLFTGPRGTGKTTTARLLARYVNCALLSDKRNEAMTKGVSAKALGDGGLPICESPKLCLTCNAFFKGNNPDLVEIDAASNRGIDDVRALREAVRVAPMLSPKKIYIVDEAHMLTKDAANALLKTLEEPPAHVIFILATTDIEKLPTTIHSRCQRFDFRTLSIPEITDRLTALTKAENATIDADAIDLLAQAAEGSIRDAESLLEQVLIFLGKKSGRDDVIRLLGLPDPLLVRQVGASLVARDSKGALEGIQALLERGGDPVLFAVRLASYLRDVLLLKADPLLAPLIEKRFGSAYVVAAREQAEQSEKAILMKLIPEVIDAVELSKRSPIPQLPLELVALNAAPDSQ